MAINTQKLLPSTKTTSALSKANVGKSFSGISIKNKTINVQKLIKNDTQSGGEIVKTLTDIDTRLKLILNQEQTQQKKKRKEKERKDFEKQEKKLEAPKEARKFNLPTLSFPGMSFLDRIKRFLFFTALGWLFTKFQKDLPKLLGIIKVITDVYVVVENTFKFLLESFVNFIDRGYKAYDKVRELAKSIGGEKAQQDFDNLSSKLNEYINYALIGGMALTGAISEFSKLRKKDTGKGSGSGYQSGYAAGYAAGLASRRGGPRYRAPGQAAAGRTLQENVQRQALTRQRMLAPTGPRGPLDRIGRGFRGAAAQLETGTLFNRGAGLQKAIYQAPGKIKNIPQAIPGKQLLRIVKGPLSRLPLIGGLIEFGLSYALGEPLGKAAFRGVGTILLGAVGSLLLPGFGTFIGGWVGAELAGKLYELLFENRKPSGKVQLKAAGGQVTRGGKAKTAPTRSLTRKLRKPRKIKPKQSVPGKDVGGKKRIKTLYPDPSSPSEIEGNLTGGWYYLLPKDQTERNETLKKLPNPYKALTNTAKILKDIPFGIGALMGGAVDIALGQKLPKDAIEGISNGISYLVQALASRQVGASISNVQKEIATMQFGGITPRLRDFTRNDNDKFKSDVNNIFNNLIQQKVNDAIREVQKQLMPGKYSQSREIPGEISPSRGPSRGPGSDPGGGPTPTGENGRLPESSLKSVGQGRCRGGCKLWTPAANAYLKMKADAAKERIYFDLESAYRSYEHQAELYEAYKRGQGNLAAPPGNSDHGWGKAIDLYPTSAQEWVRRNGRKYGWYWPPETGEPWHFVYVGGGRLEPQKQQTQLPKQQPQIPDLQNYGLKEGEQKRVKYLNKNYVIARQNNKWRVYKVNPTTGMLEEVDRTDRIFTQVLEQYRKTESPTSPKPKQPRQQPTGQVRQSGQASWYGPGFQGKETASGEIFDTNKLTAAHPTLRFGTIVTVTNKANGKSVRVKINDRGPFAVDSKGRAIKPLRPHPTRIIDLSRAAMTALGADSLANVDLSYQGGGYILKQIPRRDTQKLSSYPSYSSEGGMMLAIQPVIIEKPVPMPSGSNKAVMFPVPILSGVNNNSMQKLSRG